MKEKTPRELKKEIRETIRKEMRTKYEQEKENDRKRYEELWDRYQRQCDKANRLVEENTKLREKVEAFEDWNRRLMEFMDMPEAERGDAIKRYIADKDFEEALSNWIAPYSKFLNIFN